MTKPNFASFYTNPLDAECAEGYWDGRRLGGPEPGPNRHPAYIHGFKNGRDDAMCSRGLQKFPARTAQQAREDWAYIESALSD